MKLFHLLGERTVFEFRYSITLPSLGLAEPPSLTGVGVSICCVLVGSKTRSINCYWPAIRQGETGPLEARASVASDAVGSGPVWDLHFRLPVLDLGLDLGLGLGLDLGFGFGLGLGRIPVHERWLSSGRRSGPLDAQSTVSTAATGRRDAEPYGQVNRQKGPATAGQKRTKYPAVLE